VQRQSEEVVVGDDAAVATGAVGDDDVAIGGSTVDDSYMTAPDEEGEQSPVKKEADALTAEIGTVKVADVVAKVDSKGDEVDDWGDDWADDI
jgi:hypothetical protein